MERGQATVEWVGLLLLVALALGALAAVAPRADGRSFGGFLAHRIVCAVRAGCDDGDAGLRAAYGARDAELVRRLAPNLVYEGGERQLPVDWRRCRRRACADAADDRDADVHRTNAGERATVFTHVLRRGGRVYLQYWLYYTMPLRKRDCGRFANDALTGAPRHRVRKFRTRCGTVISPPTPARREREYRRTRGVAQQEWQPPPQPGDANPQTEDRVAKPIGEWRSIMYAGQPPR